MTRKLLTLADRPEFLYDVEHCRVLETYDFGTHACAYIDVPDESVSTMGADDRVLATEDPMTAEPLYEPESVTPDGDVATIEDVRQLHDVPRSGATGEGVTVAVMDSGVDTGHPVFADVPVEQIDVTGAGNGDDSGHGTGVAGQITRLAPDAELISLRIFGAEGSATTNVVMRAYEWLHANTGRYDVVNMSWGAASRSPAIDRTHDELIGKGVRDVTAAGNSGKRGGSPATADRAFSVGATTVEGRMAEFSAYNPDRDNPDVAAIGKDVRLARAENTTLGPSLDGPWVKSSGTSFAAPAVSGMVAKLLSARERGPAAVTRAFEAGARNIPDQPRDGAGLADYRAALRATGESGAGDTEGEAGSVMRVGDRRLAVFEAPFLQPGRYRATRLIEEEGTVLRLRAVDDAGTRNGDGE
jgi:subtilisin family serine protease